MQAGGPASRKLAEREQVGQALLLGAAVLVDGGCRLSLVRATAELNAL